MVCRTTYHTRTYVSIYRLLRNSAIIFLSTVLSMLILRRLPEYFETTPGHIFFYDRLICSCLELPYRNNAPFISAIPDGTYQLAFTYSSRLKRKTLEIVDVPGRTGIRLHSANVAEQLKGCIAPCVQLVIEEYRLYAQSSIIATTALEKLVLQENVLSLSVA